MKENTTKYDGTLRVVMWLDAFWSAAATLIAIRRLPRGRACSACRTARTSRSASAPWSPRSSWLACGAVTGVLLMLRMNAGHYTMPADLRIPLPRGMVPHIGPDA